MKRIMNIVRFLMVFALNFYIMVAFHSYISFLFMIGMILFLAYSVIATVYVAQNIRLEIIPPASSMYKGESAMLRFKLRNSSFFVLVNAMVQMEVSNSFYEEKRQFCLNLPVRAKGKSEADWVLKLESLGHIAVKAVSVQVTDLFGIFGKQAALDAMADFLVLPGGASPEADLENSVRQIFLQGAAETSESRNKGYDFPEVSGIRNYIPGDKLQDIHWKLSAKQDELMVKERVSVAGMQINILLDLEDDEERQLEFVLELADGVTKALVRQNLPFVMYYYNTNTAELCSISVGSERERMQWLQQLMYCCHCDGKVNAKALFGQEHPGEIYLYIGAKRAEEDKPCVCGRQRAVAVLRG